jgi:16S rRNA (cytidine1402-2'-O)-methyltransferase
LATSAAKQPVIYVVATPIGNLDDLTLRAARVLGEVDVVAAEDTRNTARLLAHLGITGKRLVAYHDHVEAERSEALVTELVERGLALALVSDAGTPLISDPGYRLVAAARARGVTVHPIPGPSALTALASSAGLPTDRLLFVGFLPTRAGARTAEMELWAAAQASVVFFESTRRLARTLGEIQALYPTAQVAVGRELTKLYEEIVTGSIDDALAWVRSRATLKGEATVMIAPPRAGDDASGALDLAKLRKEAARAFARGATLKDLLKTYRDVGLKRPELYRLLLEAKGERD